MDRKQIKQNAKYLLQQNRILYAIGALFSVFVFIVALNQKALLITEIGSFVIGFLLTALTMNLVFYEKRPVDFKVEGKQIGRYILSQLLTFVVLVPAYIIAYFGVVFIMSGGLVALLSASGVAAIMAVLGILMVICGIILAFWISLKYYFATFLAVDMENAERGAWQCLKESAELTRNSKWELFIFVLSFTPWLFLIGLTYGIAGFFVYPYLYVALCLYLKEKQSNQKKHTASGEEAERQE